MTGGGELLRMRRGCIITKNGKNTCMKRPGWLAKKAVIAWRSVAWVSFYTSPAVRLTGLDSHADSQYPIKAKGKV